MDVSLYIFLAAYLLDLLFGDPASKYHLVNIIGIFLKKWEHFLFQLNIAGTIFYGVVFSISGIVIITAMYGLLSIALTSLSDKYYSLIFIVNTVIVFFCIAFRSMLDHVKPVCQAIKQNDLPEAQNRVQRIVGRDSSLLDSNGVCNAAIESVAESYVDGFFAPLFWFAMGGFIQNFIEIQSVNLAVCAILIYRVVNTLDSLVGYRNTKYIKFGKFSARLDDVLNYFPARISIFTLTVASLFLRFNAKQALKIWKRDRKKHASPNAAQSESFFAGALGIQLGGPTVYSYGTVDKPYLGDKIKTVSVSDIQKAMQLYSIGSVFSIVFLIIFFTLYSGQIFGLHLYS